MNVYKRYGAEYYGRFAHAGKPYLRALGTTDKDEAMRRLRKLKKAAVDGRFDQLEQSKARRSDIARLDDIFQIYRNRSRIRTKENNINALLAVLRVGSGNDALGGTSSSALLTRNLMADFQTKWQARAGDNCLLQDTAAISANAYRRQARSLFTPEMMPYYSDLQLPDLTGFLAVRPLREPTKQFRLPDDDIIEKIRNAAPALKQTDPNAYRIYLLSLGCGLRAKEIAFAQRDWIENAGTIEDPKYRIRIQISASFRSKNNRERIVPLETCTYRELMTIQTYSSVVPTPGDAEYILEGHKTERKEYSFDRFSAWLKCLGWTRKKKAHEMRKLFGSLVNEQAGLSAAQDLLGHADPKTTKGYYVAPVCPEIKIFSAA